jgi:hypothetical protein
MFKLTLGTVVFGFVAFDFGHHHSAFHTQTSRFTQSRSELVRLALVYDDVESKIY